MQLRFRPAEGLAGPLMALAMQSFAYDDAQETRSAEEVKRLSLESEALFAAVNEYLACSDFVDHALLFAAFSIPAQRNSPVFQRKRQAKAPSCRTSSGPVCELS